MSEENAVPASKSRKKILAQPTFTEISLKKAAAELQRRRKYDEGYSSPEFDAWTAAFTIDRSDHKTRLLFKTYRLDARDPYHWRALLEAFVRAYAKFRGRPDEKTPESFFKLAIDVAGVIQEHSVDENNSSDVATALQKFEPYKGRYAKAKSDVLRKEVKSVTKLIGPMEEGALLRLAKIDPDRFFDALGDEDELRRWD
jgi:hypothetical protein